MARMTDHLWSCAPFNGSTATDSYTDDLLRDQTFTLDAKGRVVYSTDAWGREQVVSASYSPLGHLFRRHNYVPTSEYGVPVALSAIERFTNDAIGNRTLQRDTSSAASSVGWMNQTGRWASLTRTYGRSTLPAPPPGQNSSSPPLPSWRAPCPV